jgi:hypothetical protein
MAAGHGNSARLERRMSSESVLAMGGGGTGLGGRWNGGGGGASSASGGSSTLLPPSPTGNRAPPLQRGGSNRSLLTGGGLPGGGTGGSLLSVAAPPMNRGASNRSLLSSGSSSEQLPAPVQRRGSNVSLDASGIAAGLTGADRVNAYRAVAVEMLQTERVDARAMSANWFCLGLSKEDAIARLPKKEGAFVIRPNTEHFATLTMVVQNKLYNAHILDSPQGLHFKKSTSYQLNLSALVAYYKLPSQKDLPRCLVAW